MNSNENDNFKHNAGFGEEPVLDDEDVLEASHTEEDVYPMYNINVERGFYTVFELKRKYDSKDKRIILDSEFQRESVWKPIQKAELVESILMGLPLPVFYFNEDKKGRLIVVDGRQRLTALFEYLDDKWPLKGLKILTELNENKFSKLDPLVQSKIEDYQIQAHVIQLPTPDRIKFDIFDRVNRAGTQLNKQEIRNALYQGNATALLNKIVKSKEFLKATGSAFVNNSRMKDRYIILRFLALEIYFGNKLVNENGELYEYRNDMDELLGLCMEYFNNASEQVCNEYYDLTIKGLAKSYEILGSDAFRMIVGEKRSPVNMNLFECIMHLMVNISKEMNFFPQEIVDEVESVKSDDKFLDSIGNHRDSLKKIIVRYELINELIRRIKQ